MSPRNIEDDQTPRKSISMKASVTLKAGANCVEIRPLFSYDSKYLMIASGWDIKVMSTSSGECLRILQGHSSKIISLERNPDNQFQILSCSEDGCVIYWDYVDGIVLKVLKINVEKGLLAGFLLPASNCPFYFVQKQEGSHCLWSVTLKEKSILNEPEVALENVEFNQHYFSFGSNGEFVATISGHDLTILYFLNAKIYKFFSEVLLHCVACHPHNHCVATGDQLGRIILWSNFKAKKKVSRLICHWHTLPVSDLAFSVEGMHLFSGGGECVLVKWNLQIEDKTFLPRMGLPIVHVVIAPSNSFIATAHVDNALCLISPQFQLIQFYQGLCQGNPWNENLTELIPTGLIYDVKNQRLVLNGKPGHLQFYSLQTDKQIFSLDIAGQNYISQERDKTIINTQVDKVALNDTSEWLATFQYRDDGETSPEIVLKFWKWEEKIQNFSLSTCVYLPHSQKLTALGFQPSRIDESALLASTSLDGKFKTWTLDKNSVDSDQKETWQCLSMGYFRGQSANQLDFSQDGSLLAIAFGEFATLWTPTETCHKATLVSPVSTEAKNAKINQIKFGLGLCSHLLVASTSNSMTVWNVINSVVHYHISVEVSILVKDYSSELFAAFSTDGTMFVFSPANPEPILIQEETSASSILAGVFVPRQKILEDCQNHWLKKSQLYFMNERQELMLVDVPGLETSREDKLMKNLLSQTEDEDVWRREKRPFLPRTQFEALIARKVKSDVETMDVETFDKKGREGDKMMENILQIPSHALPPVTSLCLQFMTSLLAKPKKKPS